MPIDARSGSALVISGAFVRVNNAPGGTYTVCTLVRFVQLDGVSADMHNDTSE